MRDTPLDHRLAFYTAAAEIFACALMLTSCGASGSTSTTPTSLTKCAVSFDTSASSIPAAGGTGSVTVNTERECQWTAAPNVSWLSITSGSAGQGSGTVQFAAAANVDPVARTGALIVNDGSVQVTQAAAQCTFQLSQPSASFPQAGGSGSVDVRASSSLCPWSATASDGWITLASAASGKGSGSVAFTVAPTTGPPRTGSVTIAGLSFSVTQSAGCAYAVSPLGITLDPSGGARSVDVATAAGCPWSAATNDAWITLTAGATGTGPGSVAFSVASTSGPSRSGTLTVAGQIVTVVESQGCSFSINPASASAPAGGATGSFDVHTADGCGWTAASAADWLRVTAGATGTGSGTVQYAVDANTGAARSAAITAGGQSFTIAQDGGCSFSISPANHNSPSGGDTVPVGVTAPAGCSWTSTSNASWIGITSGQTGSGNGTVQLAVAANSGAERTGTVTIAGQIVTVNQDSGCTFAIAPSSQDVAQAGGTGTVTVTSTDGCAWTASSNAPWITVTAGATGSGSGSVQFSVDANATGASRSGTITIAGQMFTVNQAGS